MPQENTAVLHIGWMSRAVAALTRAGADVTCVLTPADLKDARGAHPRMRTVVVPDQTNVEGILAGLARESLRIGEFDAVCSGLEFCLAAAAVLSDLGRLTTSATRRAIAMRDKAVQKALVRAAGVATADCVTVDTLNEVSRQADRFPVVIKPLNGSGAQSTYRLERPDSLDAHLEAEAGKGPWLVEDYISGKEFQVDGVVRNGEITLLSVSRYLENLIDIHDGGLVAHIALPPESNPDLYERIRLLAHSSLKALEHHDGVFHLEVFRRGDEIVFGECCGRVGGGRTDEVVRRSFGIDLHDEWVRVLLGRPSAVSLPPEHTAGVVHGGMNLHAPHGPVLQAPAHDEVLARPGVVHAELHCVPGWTMPDVTAASHLRAGVVVVSGTDDREVEARMRDLADWYARHVVVASAGEPGGR
ncbi:acetyl-CoA carboxylase biotin carboxylase subunit family protein [Streptomyces sp. NPDC051664]|uniref:acetyl-CoA carboxylase biotin carboxylase subunit family protein n=1 Tax=Streptomyces sp. NPDC051664 TaxID=3365668 RepID=UPI00379EE732